MHDVLCKVNLLDASASPKLRPERRLAAFSSEWWIGKDHIIEFRRRIAIDGISVINAGFIHSMQHQVHKAKASRSRHKLRSVILETPHRWVRTRSHDIGLSPHMSGYQKTTGAGRGDGY